MNYITISGVLLLLISFGAFGQTKEQDLRLQVLKSNRTGHEFIFKTEDRSSTHLTYLGWLSSKKGVHFKIMNSVWSWGHAHRATSRILIFDENDKYLGNYPLTITDDLPTFIKGNKLVFINKRANNSCDPKLTTYVNFDEGIPHEFFRRCSVKGGDIYTFNKE
ncbi:hypothetical protein HQ865_00975 [Mucilaginibacter mali]|uniref:Uncharacterized protein n=1 Tax=Mucilaginibacter mali TaxID=2740462 RepID=A0A7D4QP87_9SPHI|nr:hypothetical protein [Mucilaginibacter mali]QKJ28389.1 hypothetical protein HQ865_00975 [Mucilaginibacter mali]